jgi:hypothetical protein
MDATATIKAGFIEISTRAWIGQRTGGPLEEMSAHCADFAHDLAQRLRPRLRGLTPLEMIEVFIIARTGLDWADAQTHARVQLGTQHALTLSQPIAVHRYHDPEYGPVVITAPAQGGYLTGYPLMYADTTRNPEDWATLAVRISCPRGHEFHYDGTQITSHDAPPWPVEDVFPDARIVTAGDAAAAGSWRIMCPTCAAHCDVVLADITAPENRNHFGTLAMSAL